jgi:ADP-heptose:LPS heptosyltransferase
MPAIIFLRSYGDFTIAISVLRSGAPWQFYASDHLKPLYDDLQKNDPSLNLPIEFVSLGIRHKILAWFTNKHLFSKGACKEVMSLKDWKQSLGAEADLYLEQRKRAWLLSLFIGDFQSFIHTNGNVYDSYAQKFSVSTNDLLFESKSAYKKILILPESRKPSKAFSISFINKLVSVLSVSNDSIRVGYFKNIPDNRPTGASLVTHTAFSDLITIIKDADLVITADSLPAHLSQLLSKPHFIFYAGKPNEEWLTPFAHKYNSFATIGDTSKLLNYINA